MLLLSLSPDMSMTPSEKEISKRSRKVYFTVYSDEGGVYFTSKRSEDGGSRYKIRLAGRPKFLLSHLVKKHGNEEGIRRYTEILESLLEIGKEGYSPLVLYIYPQDGQPTLQENI